MSTFYSPFHYSLFFADSGNDGDPEFHVTAEMLVHEIDNENTLEEEESFDDVDHATEIAELQKVMNNICRGGTTFLARMPVVPSWGSTLYPKK